MGSFPSGYSDVGERSGVPLQTGLVAQEKEEGGQSDHEKSVQDHSGPDDTLHSDPSPRASIGVVSHIEARR